jgi:hypothetical protein
MGYNNEIKSFIISLIYFSNLYFFFILKIKIFLGAECEGAGYYDAQRCLTCSDGYLKTPSGATDPGVCGCNSI